MSAPLSYTRPFNVNLDGESFTCLLWVSKAMNKAKDASLEAGTASVDKLACDIIKAYIATMHPQLAVLYAERQDIEEKAIDAAIKAASTKEK